MKALILFLILVHALASGQEDLDLNSDYPPDVPPPAEVEDVIALAFRGQPQLLLTLKSRPLSETFWRLQGLWSEKGQLDPANVGPYAKAALLDHPGLEKYLHTRLKQMLDLRRESLLDPNWSEKHRPFKRHPSDLLRQYATFIGYVPDERAVRLLGWLLENGDDTEKIVEVFRIEPPAQYTREFLAVVLKKLFNEELPPTLEAARQWWRENAGRFKGKRTAAATGNVDGSVEGVHLEPARSESVGSDNARSEEEKSLATQDPTILPDEWNWPLVWAFGGLIGAGVGGYILLRKNRWTAE